MQKQDENIAKIAEDFFYPSNCSVSFLCQDARSGKIK
jgi:hypothetical protein